jgi:aryl-alcohol dehydrogenase (NADP+)
VGLRRIDHSRLRQHVAERRGLARFRTEQPPYSRLEPAIEREVLPTCRRYGMGVMAWSRSLRGMLTGKYRKGENTPDTLRAKFFPKAISDEGSLDAVEQLIPLAQSAGISLMHMALTFVVSHPALTAAIFVPRTEDQPDGLLSGAIVQLSDEMLDRIDEIVPPGVDVAPLEGLQQKSTGRVELRPVEAPSGGSEGEAGAQVELPAAVGEHI